MNENNTEPKLISIRSCRAMKRYVCSYSRKRMNRGDAMVKAVYQLPDGTMYREHYLQDKLLEVYQNEETMENARRRGWVFASY